MSSRNSKNSASFFINTALALLSALLLSLPWFETTSLTLLVAFVPLFMLRNRTTNKAFIWYSLFTLIVWHVTTLIWVAKATWMGPVAATIAGTTLCIIPLICYSLTVEKTNRFTSYLLFISAWLAAEFAYIHGEISFPWLILGNGFALDAKLVQWYEFTGVLGGSLWVLLSNILVYETIRKRSMKYAAWTAAIIVIPIIVSFTMYFAYKEKENPITVTIVQPNIDPYNEKFGSMSMEQQLEIIERLANEAPSDVDFIIAPETAIDGTIYEDYIAENWTIQSIKKNVSVHYPEAEFITGATVFRLYPKDIKEAPTFSARKRYDDRYYDVINGALQIGDSHDSIPLYIKSKLVIGVEMLPYPQVLTKILDYVDLGGMAGQVLTQEERNVFYGTDGTPTGTAICFESVYGEHYNGYIKKGAQAMFIITNDGWWDDTYGYKHHFNYARLRAIETRRSIARSANTGISAFINQRGDIIKELGWDIRGTITDDINLNDKITFYARYGDVIGRIAGLTFILLLLYLLAVKMKRRSQLIDGE